MLISADFPLRHGWLKLPQLRRHLLGAVIALHAWVFLVSPCVADSVANCGDLSAAFQFDEQVGGGVYPSISSYQQQRFKDSFCRAVKEVTSWLTENEWLPKATLPMPPLPGSGAFLPREQLYSSVSNAYNISRALVPSWLSQRGWMEFPAVEVVAGDTAIAHELIHVFFPNGNRMLAEGFAVYVQQALFSQNRTNPAFPNFGENLDQLVGLITCPRQPGFIGIPLDKINLVALDWIAVPNELQLRAGRVRVDLPPANYVVAGSFVQFLIEKTRPGDPPGMAMKRFRDLYLMTPLVPQHREPGDPDRWSSAYGTSLLSLQDEWRQHIRSVFQCPAAPPG
jgi:hypothetical protein